MPDILNGDPRTMSFGSSMTARETWHAAHGRDSWMPVMDAVIAALKAEGVTRIGTTSYCFGSPAAFYSALKNDAHVTVLAHPSRLTVPDDYEVRVFVRGAYVCALTC